MISRVRFGTGACLRGRAARPLTALAAALALGCAQGGGAPAGAPSSTPAPASAGSSEYPGMAAITEADLRRDLFILAGDSMHGRVGGSQDEMRASMWLAEQYREPVLRGRCG